MNELHERTLGNLLRQVHPTVLATRLYVAMFDNFSMFAISFGIGFGAILVALIVYRIVLYCGLPRSSLPRFRLLSTASGKQKVDRQDGRWHDINYDIEAQKAQYKPIFYSTRRSAVHLSALFIKYGIIIFGLYTAFGVAGVSFFSLAFSVGIVGLIGAYAFGMVLYNISGSFVVFGEGSFTENMMIKMRGVTGRIIEMTSFHTTLRCEDPKTGEVYLAYVPNRYYNEDVVLRFPQREQDNADVKVTNIQRKLRI